MIARNDDIGWMGISRNDFLYLVNTDYRALIDRLTPEEAKDRKRILDKWDKEIKKL